MNAAEAVFYAMTPCEACGHNWCFHGAPDTHVGICMGSLECSCRLFRPKDVAYQSNPELWTRLFGLEIVR